MTPSHYSTAKKNYRIINDPDDSWSSNPCFGYHAIVQMIKDGYLAEGTKIEAFGRFTFVVVEIREKYYLKKIGR